MSTPNPLRFGTFELDVHSRELRSGSTSVRLQGQPFEILCLLLEHRGESSRANNCGDVSGRKALSSTTSTVSMLRSSDCAPRSARMPTNRVRRDRATPRLSLDRGAPGPWCRTTADARRRLATASSRGAAVQQLERRHQPGVLQRRRDRGGDCAARALVPRRHGRHRAPVDDGLQGLRAAGARDRRGAAGGLLARREHATRRGARAHHGSLDRNGHRGRPLVRDLRQHGQRLALRSGRRRQRRRSINRQGASHPMSVSSLLSSRNIRSRPEIR